MKHLVIGFLILNACGGTVDIPDADPTQDAQPDALSDASPDVSSDADAGLIHHVCITDPINGAGFYDDGCTVDASCQDDAGDVGICK